MYVYKNNMYSKYANIFKSNIFIFHFVFLRMIYFIIFNLKSYNFI